jgi:hypothetical protein
MGAISALAAAVGTLRRNPIIFVGVFVLSAIGSLTTIGQVWGGFIVLGAGLAALLMTPFLTGGVLGMAEEATAGGTSLATLLSEGSANYLTLLLASIIQLIILVLTGILWAIGLLVLLLGGGVALGNIGGGAGAGTALGIGVVAVTLSVLIFFLPIYFIQFYDVAIVVSDTGAWGAFKQSFGFVRRHLLSTLGYTILAQGINLLVLIPTFWLTYGAPLSLAEVRTAAQRMAGASTVETLIPLVAYSLIAGTLISSLLVTYRVTYYTNLTSEGTKRTTT